MTDLLPKEFTYLDTHTYKYVYRCIGYTNKLTHVDYSAK